MSTFRNARELARAVERMPDKVLQKVLRASVARGVNVIRDALKAAAPVLSADDHGPHPPGLLKKSIIARVLRTRKNDRIRGGILILKDAFYWRFVEYGTKRMRPHPFIRPTAAKTLPLAVKAQNDFAIDLIRKIDID